MERNLFGSARSKLTLAYLGGLVVVSLFFSALVFGVANHQLRQSLVRPGPVQKLLERGPGPMGGDGLRDEIQQVLTERAEQGRRDLLLALGYVNIAVLVLGGGASYWFAKKTLAPIERSHQAQSRFATDASHQLRTPLTAMRTEIEVALKSDALDLAEARRILTSNLEEVVALTKLTDGLLSLAQVEAGELPRERVLLQGIIDEAKKRTNHAAKQKKIAIQSLVEPGDIWIRGHRDSLLELLNILLDNAIKFGPVKSSVDISAKKEGTGAVVSVADQGRGVLPSERERIFERGYTSSRESDTKQGRGLGLALAKTIAEAHGARITVEDAKVDAGGKGTVFRIFFPG